MEPVELSLLGNTWSNGNEEHHPIADIVIPESATGIGTYKAVARAEDAFRRMGRLDLQVHYPSLGIRDTCIPKPLEPPPPPTPAAPQAARASVVKVPSPANEPRTGRREGRPPGARPGVALAEQEPQEARNGGMPQVRART